jgi:hypothetical protein
MKEYQIKTFGKLKYPRLKSLSMLRKEINSYAYCFTMAECKELLDSVLNKTFTERFNVFFKKCFDVIFDDIKYVEYDDSPPEKNFPENWIPPIG